MENKIKIFRVDSSLKIGNGHLYRCLSLASKFKKKNNVFFFSRDLNGNLNSKITSLGYKLVKLKNLVKKKNSYKQYEKSDYEETLFHINQLKILKNELILIKDSYNLGFYWEKKIYYQINKLIVINDIPRKKHYCDILIDQTYGRLPIHYKNLIKKNTSILVGSKFTMIRSKFNVNRTKIYTLRKNINKIKKILITMGGTDNMNISLNILREMHKHSIDNEHIVTLIIGKNNINFKKIQKYIKKNNVKIYLKKDPKNIFREFLNSDLAISAGGSTLWELFALGVPTIVYKTANNQSQIIKNLRKDNLIYYFGKIDSLDKNFKKIFNILNNNNVIYKLSLNLLKTFDNKGVNRIIKKI